MARAKVKLVRIVNESKRQAALKKKKLALIKLVQTLCVLCKVKACIMICDHQSDSVANNSTLWPSRHEAEKMVSSFMSAPKKRRIKKMVTLEKFIESMVVNKNNKTRVLKVKNDQMEMEKILHKIDVYPTISMEFVGEILSQAYFYIEELIQKIEEKENSS